MELTIYLILIGLSVIFIISGIALRSPLLGMVGFTFMFLLGLAVLNDDITIKTGEFTQEVYIYGNNLSGYHWDYSGTQPDFNPAELDDTSAVWLFHMNQTTINVYESLDEVELHLYGWLLAILGALGFVLMLFELPQSLKGTYKTVKEDLHK